MLLLMCLLALWTRAEADVCADLCTLNPTARQTVACLLCPDLQGLTTVPFSLCPAPGKPPITRWMCMAAVQNCSMLYPGPCGCPLDCGGHGRCLQSQCVCDEGFSGPSCSAYGGACPFGTSMNDCSAQDRAWAPPAPWRFPSDAYGWGHPLFNRSTITQIHLNMTEEDLHYALDPRNVDSKRWLKCSLTLENAAISITLPDASIRIQGGASREFFQKSWKVKFHEKVFGVHGMSLKAGVMEPTLLREFASMDTLSFMGVPVYRGSYYQLFINGVSFGAHLGLELMDRAFLKSRFAHASGDLYKCTTTFRYFGPLTNASQETYEKVYHLDEGNGNFSAVVSLIQAITNGTLAEVSAQLDIDMFLRTFAAEVVTGNWDGTWNGNNYYLFAPPKHGSPFLYWRHDLDLSIGAIVNAESQTYPDLDLSTSNVWNWTETGPAIPALGKANPLVHLLMTSASVRGDFKEHLLKASSFLAKLATLDSSMAQSLVANDEWRAIDFAWNPQDAKANVNTTIKRASFQWMAMTDFISRRVNSIAQQTQ